MYICVCIYVYVYVVPASTTPEEEPKVKQCRNRCGIKLIVFMITRIAIVIAPSVYESRSIPRVNANTG